jgi:polyisoprenoid-binding protein YceI
MAWEFDSAHTQIEFSAKHMMITTVKGRFDKFSGNFDLEEENPAASRVDVTIEAASIDTGQERRDNHLRSPDFLDVEKFPTITFKSTQVELLADHRAKVTGDLTIRGVTRPAELDVTREGELKDMQGQRRQAYSATATISRKEWGLEWNVALESGGWLVSDAVKIAIEAEVFVPAAVVAPVTN